MPGKPPSAVRPTDHEEDLRAQRIEMLSSFTLLAIPSVLTRADRWIFWHVRGIFSFGVSLMGHAVALACLWYVSPPGNVQWVPVQSGQASVESQASMSSAPQMSQDSMVEVANSPPVEQAISKPLHRSKQLPDAPIGSMTRRTSSLEVALLSPLAAQASASIESFSDSVPAHRTNRSIHEKELASFDAASCDESLEPPRTNVAHRRTLQMVSASVASRSSAASTASNGAKAKVPELLYNPAPEYPAEALAARQTGRVLLRVRLDTDGSVIEASIYSSCGLDSLDAAALAAVRHWRFSPAETGTTAPRELAVPVRFVVE